MTCSEAHILPFYGCVGLLWVCCNHYDRPYLASGPSLPVHLFDVRGGVQLEALLVTCDGAADSAADAVLGFRMYANTFAVEFILDGMFTGAGGFHGVVLYVSETNCFAFDFSRAKRVKFLLQCNMHQDGALSLADY